MISQLQPHHYNRIQSLCKGFDYQLIITAVIELTSPGHVLVDNPDHPSSCFISTAEGCFLIGNPTNRAFNTELGKIIQKTVTSTKAVPENEKEFILNVFPEAWTRQFSTLFPKQTPLLIPRHYYTCTHLIWKRPVPTPYTIAPITQSLLTNPNVSIPKHITSWITSNWGSQDAFLKHGFGFTSMHYNQLVSWSLTDCVSGTRCEIGIQTQPKYRRQGLATTTAAATVNHALQHGYHNIGWHSSQDNIGSIKVAENIGFKKTTDYTWYLFNF